MLTTVKSSVFLLFTFCRPFGHHLIDLFSHFYSIRPWRFDRFRLWSSWPTFHAGFMTTTSRYFRTVTSAWFLVWSDSLSWFALVSPSSFFFFFFFFFRDWDETTVHAKNASASTVMASWSCVTDLRMTRPSGYFYSIRKGEPKLMLVIVMVFNGLSDQDLIDSWDYFVAQ